MAWVAALAWVQSLTQELPHAMSEAKKKKRKSYIALEKLTKTWHFQRQLNPKLIEGKSVPILPHLIVDNLVSFNK